MKVKMIVNQGKHYLYRHIRLDTNKPFYIGIGTKNQVDLNSTKDSVLYKRAFHKKRNNIWGNIIKKTNYEIEIVLESDDYDFIKEKEVEFIKLYKKIVPYGGTLSNLSDGGNGSLGYKLTQKQRDHLSSIRKGKVGKDHHLSKEVFVYSLNGDFINKYDINFLRNNLI